MNFETYIPLIAPFIIGLLAGVVIKRVLKLILAIVALVIALVATGYLSMEFEGMKERAIEYLPEIIEGARDEIQILPYSSTAFLIGLSLGIWKG